MEAKLAFIGVIMCVYALLTERFLKRNSFENRTFAAAWHALFCACAAAIICFVLSITIENRNLAMGRQNPGWLIFLWLAAVLASTTYGFWNSLRAPRGGDKITKADLEWAEVIYSPMFAAAFIMYFFVQQFVIPSASMRQTLLEGDRLVVNKMVYGFRLPFTKTKFWRLKPVGRGDIVVFEFPSNSKKEVDCGGVQHGRDFIKRVIGLPGDKIEARNSVVHVNGEPLPEESYAQFLDPAKYPAPAELSSLTAGQYQELWQRRDLGRLCGSQIKDNFGPVTVPESSYFVMGDNRDNSCDSRFWGPVPDYRVKGKAWVIYWPFSRMRLIR